VISGIELCRTCGISYRQLDYWCRRGVLEPMTNATPGSGIPRPFTEEELRVARALAELRKLHVPLDLLIVVASQLRRFDESDWRGLLLVDELGRIVRPPFVSARCWTIDLDALALARVAS
jgi:DNA-binding transcriptional MerR regulator